MENKIAYKSKKINPVVFLLLATVIIISLKWITSYLFYSSEPLINKIIFDLGDHAYFPLILNLSNLNFNPDYLLDFFPSKIIPLPIYYLIYHSAAYSIITEHSFIFVEYFALFLFLYILYKIFQELKISNHFSVAFALAVFLLPEFLIYLNKIEINLINFNIIKNLYSFNVPRPIISSIYFFWGLLLAIYYYKYKNNNFFFILVGLNLALNFGSYPWHFVILSLLFFILFLNKILKNDKVYFNYLIKKIFIIFVFFLIFSLPFFIILFFSEKEYVEKVGTVYFNFEKKKILLGFLLSHFLNLKFLLLFFVNTTFLFFLLKKQNLFCKETITILYIFFISSCISPILYTLFSPVINEFYHFTDLVIVTGILIFFIFITLVLTTIFTQNSKAYKFYNCMHKNNFYFLLLILFLSITFNLNYFLNYKNYSNPDFRKDLNTLYNYLNKNNYNQKLNIILTFNTKIQAWWLLLENKKLSTIDSSFTSLKFRDLELSFIDNLKFLNVSEINFQKIIDNKKGGWRYYNRYIRYISLYKYQANSLTTYKNSQNFNNDVLKFIKNSSPLLTQQVAIPNDEIERLTTLFKNTHNLHFKNPDIIILEKNSLITQYSNINLNKYCMLTATKYLDIYLNLDKTNCYPL